MPMCLTAKPTLEWAGSTVQVPVGMAVVMVAVALMADRSLVVLLCAQPRIATDCDYNYHQASCGSAGVPHHAGRLADRQ